MKHLRNSNLIILTLFIVLSSCSKEEKKDTVLRPVRYQTVSEEGNTKTRIFSGVAQAGLETKLSFKVSGTIQQLNAKVGQQVKAGQLIASIDPSDYLVQLEVSRAGVKNADAIEDQAESNFERISLLYENSNASLSDYEAARSSYESAKASEKSMKEQKKLAESRVGYTNLRAPVNGVITDVFIEENENVQIGQRIVVLNSGTDLEVNVAIPDLYISRVKAGDKVKIIFTAISEKEYNGVVSEVAFTAGRAQTTYPVIIKLTDTDNQIRPGMSVDVYYKFSVGESDSKIAIPAFSVCEDLNGKYVWVVNPDPGKTGIGGIEKRNVTVGELTNEGIEIKDGLNVGDHVVTAGVSKISDGMKVKLIQ